MTLPADFLNTPTRALSAWVANANSAHLSPSMVRATEQAFVNWLGCALGAIEEPAVRAVLDTARALGGPAQATIVGHDLRLDPVNAALANGVAGNALDFDDMHVGTLIHPSGPVVPAALAIAEHVHASGAALLRAVAVGVEVECRLGLALFPAHYDAGWHSTATLGTLGAAAAAAQLLGLDVDHTRRAFGIAATQASGLRAMLPNACKSFNVGKAAAAGVLAALLARAGLDSATDVLEEKHGLFAVFGQPRGTALLPWASDTITQVGAISLKPYPCGVVIHPAIDAALEIAARHDIDAARIVSIAADVHPRAIDLADRPDPHDAITGRFSLQHALAIALARRAAGHKEFATTDVRDPDILRLRTCVSLRASAELTPGQACVRVTLASGATFEQRIDAPSGSPARPLTDAQLEAKFLSLAGAAIPQQAAQALLRQCTGLSARADCAALGDELRAAARTRRTA